MKKHHYAVILAGGKGERFWPLSTERRPKQFLALAGGATLLSQAVDRLHGVVPPERIFVITNLELLPAAREACPVLPARNIIGEPIGRDTAAAVALGAALVKARDPQAVFSVLTADHIIGHLPDFRRTLQAALDRADKDPVLVTIGLPPTEPSTAYGYIEARDAAGEAGGVEFLKVRRFVEKPDLDTARAYLKAKRFFWNSGMFIWSVKTLEAALQAHCPALLALMGKLGAAVGHADFAAVLEKEYARLERISIDYALMEKADNILMVRGKFDWDDVGSWTALGKYLARDTAGNAIRGSVERLDCRDNLVVSDGRLTALVGVRDLVVVQAENVTLVCAKDRAQDVKKLVEQLRASKRHTGVL